MPLLFDDTTRTYMKPALGGESHFHFYNRSALPTVDRLRKMLQRWVDRLPESKQKGIVNRMRHTGVGSRDKNRSFDSAFLELVLHEFLRGTGAEVEVEPNVAGRTPDFYAAEVNEAGNVQGYYVEAFDVSIADSAESGASWNEKICKDVLDEIESPDFYLIAETSGVLESMPRKKNLKAPFERLLREVDYEAVVAQYEVRTNWDALPSASFQHGSWKLTGRLLPVSRDRRPREAGSRFVGVGFGKSGMFDDIGKIRGRLDGKAEWYKQIPNLVIAVRSEPWDTPMDEVLFGTQALTVYVPNDPSDSTLVPEPHLSQMMDGFWFNSTGPQNQHVIGVLLFDTLHPHCVHKAQATFFANPYVDASLLPSWTNAIRHAEYKDGRITMVDGVPPSIYMADHEAINDLFEGTPLSS